MFNGIEQVEDFGLDVEVAFFRVYDAASARWWQADPKYNEGMSLYSGFGNNPVKLSDILGDTTRVYSLQGELIYTLNDNYTNQEHFVSDEIAERLSKNKNTLDKFNRQGGRSLRTISKFVRSSSDFYIGTNTRTQMGELISNSDGLESGFLLYKSGNNRELQVKEVGTRNRQTNSGEVIPGRANNVAQGSLLGYGHTHTSEGYKKLFPNARNVSIELFNEPSSRGTGDYENFLYGIGNRASPQFIVSPLGYTIYSSMRNTPKGSLHNYPYQIVNSGNIYNYQGINVTNLK